MVDGGATSGPRMPGSSCVPSPQRRGQLLDAAEFLRVSCGRRCRSRSRGRRSACGIDDPDSAAPGTREHERVAVAHQVPADGCPAGSRASSPDARRRCGVPAPGRRAPVDVHDLEAARPLVIGLDPCDAAAPVRSQWPRCWRAARPAREEGWEHGGSEVVLGADRAHAEVWQVGHTTRRGARLGQVVDGERQPEGERPSAAAPRRCGATTDSRPGTNEVGVCAAARSGPRRLVPRTPSSAPPRRTRARARHSPRAMPRRSRPRYADRWRSPRHGKRMATPPKNTDGPPTQL